jgi:hypothetical protein
MLQAGILFGWFDFFNEQTMATTAIHPGITLESRSFANQPV